ncbi:hypothetical protein CBR_g21825 [Chara braunii]|uniref:EF-hand domain-containing protein n=1 Tax=Chara braunii TaxID=69332 RepID=A0A388JUU0_CHABU|nr:hypothetical protein CBR_g21825 [Chara braunii]|eukprot:GBG61482.1 hypothetical protein CBR_g21825 [Chara braunii]
MGGKDVGNGDGLRTPLLTPLRLRKVDMIFRNFDKDANGFLDREEMANLVIAVNPRVTFTAEQINAILEEVFRTYAKYIDTARGLTIQGLRQTYADGAGDVDRDFSALGYSLDSEGGGPGTEKSIVIPITPVTTAPPTPMARSPPPARAPAGRPRSPTGGVPGAFDVADARRGPFAPPPSVTSSRPPGSLGRPGPFPAYTDISTRSSIRGGSERERDESGILSNASSADGIVFANTHVLLSDLDRILTKEDEANWRAPGAGAGGGPGSAGEEPAEEELGPEGGSGKNVSAVSKEVTELQSKIDKIPSSEEAFEAHMEIGKVLADRSKFREALVSFTKAAQLKPTNVKAHFRCGNVLYRMKNYGKARESYEKGIEVGKANPMIYTSVMPQLHVNLGITLEAEGMLLCACDHYREAAILNTQHFRALKLLGSALFGVGELDKAEQALEHAIYLRPSYADAHCDYGSTLHALGEDEKAKRMFKRALELFPEHANALYNYAGLLRDMGEFAEAVSIYDRILKLEPKNWRAMLNKAVALLGDKQHEEAKLALKDAFKITNRVELYDAIRHLKRISRKNKQLSSALESLPEQATPGRDGELAYGGQALVVELHRFQRYSQKMTSPKTMAEALEVRAFQRHTRVCRFDVTKLRAEVKDGPGIPADKKVRKAVVERIMRKLLHFLSAETFQGAMRAMNERVLSVLETKRNGMVDLALFFALIAPLCGGDVDERKRVAFQALVWASDKTSGEISERDAFKYFKVLRTVYLPPKNESSLLRQEQEEEEEELVAATRGGARAAGGTMSFREFKEVFNDPVKGFDLLETVLMLEQRDRIRHSGLACAVCAYTLVGLRYKEVNVGFSLCSLCYGEGKVPQEFKRETYVFKEMKAENRLFPERFSRFVSSGGARSPTSQPASPSSAGQQQQQQQQQDKRPSTVAAH